MQLKSCIVGIDFGTTSLSAVVVNVDNKHIEKVFNYNTNAYIPFTNPYQKEQSIEQLSALFLQLLSAIDAIPRIRILAYGFTGQMHGIVGLNEKNEAVTNLVTWQDQSGITLLPEGISLSEKIKVCTGKNIADGYGITTLYKWICCEHRNDIVSFCTIADYFARLLAKTNTIFIDATNAHSIGLFDMYANEWDCESIRKLNLDTIHFPSIVSGPTILGYTETENTPVVCAIGDNQASFLGSVINEQESILLNIGTGTQLSFLIPKDEIFVYQKYIDGYETQLRPFDTDSYLIATSFISGGSVYTSLFNFFKEVGVSLLGIDQIDESVLWNNMERLGRISFPSADPLQVIPLLEGKRNNLSSKGSITNLSTSNFTPGNFIIGFLEGLATYYKTGYFKELENRIKYIHGSGNGLKRNTLFKEIIENTFGHSLSFSPYNEEAAVGAAYNSAIAIGLLHNRTESESFLTGLSHESFIH